MFVDEIEPHKKVKITVHIGSQLLEFETETAELTDKQDIKIIEKLAHKFNAKIMVLKLVEKDRKTVTFPTTNVIYKVESNKDDKLYIWNQVVIRVVDLTDYKLIGNSKDKIKYTIVVSRQDVASTNRRNNFRLWLGVYGVIQIGHNRKTDSALVKDISAGGVALIVKNDVKGEVGDLVHLTFDDESNGTHFSITVIIVRVLEIDTEFENEEVRRKLFGCKLNSDNTAIQKYIVQKQRENRQRQLGYNNDKR